MKNKLLIGIIFSLIPILSYSQNNDGLSIVYGKSIGHLQSSFLRNMSFSMGGGVNDLGSNNVFGLRYFSSFKSKRNTNFEIGLNYLNGKIKFESNADPDAPMVLKDFYLVSMPFYINHPFGKYFYFNYGLMLDYQNYDGNNNFGVGIGFGLGARYDYKNYFFFINPKYEKHLFLSDEFGLYEFGILFGIGYKL